MPCLPVHRLLAAAALLAAGSVQATCTATRPVLTAPDPTAAPAARYAALIARVGWIADDADLASWRTLVADLRRDPQASPAMLAASLAELANGAGDRAESVKLATEAKAIADAHGLTDDPIYPRILDVLVRADVAARRLDAADPLIPDLLARTRDRFGERSVEWAQANDTATELRHAQGRYEDALALIATGRDVALACLPPDDDRIGSTLGSYAVVLGSTGRLDEGLTAQFRTIRWRIDHGRTTNEAGIRTFTNLGMELRNVSRLGEAEAVLREANQLAVDHRATTALRADTLAFLALTLGAEGRYDEANALFARALEVSRQGPPSTNALGISGLFRRWADAAQASGDIATALQRRELALAEMKNAPPTHPELARAQLEYASTLLLAGRPVDASRIAGPAIATVRKGMTLADGRRLSSEVAYARVVGATQGPAAGYAAFLPTSKLLENLLLDPVTTRGELVVLAPLLAPSLALFAKFDLETGRDEDAFRALQLAALSTIVLVTNDMAARQAVADPVARQLVIDLQDAVRARRGLERERANAVTANRDVGPIQGRIDGNDAKLKATVGELDRRFPDYREVGRPSPVTLAQFRARLAPGEILLAPLPQYDGTYVIAVTREGLSWGKTPPGFLAVDALIARLRSAITAVRTDGKRAHFDVAAARALYDAVVPVNLKPLLASHPSLLWYAPGKLAAVPPGLLAAPGGRDRAPNWLIRSHDVTVLPTLGKPLARETAATGRGRFVGIGAPALGAPVRLATRGLNFRGAAVDTGALEALPSLGDAHGELVAMKAAVDAADGLVLAGAAATEAAVKALPRQRLAVLAFATHGLDAGDLPGLTEPALVMTPPARPDGDDDGLLTASEIAALKLDADWVILSACDTAGGGGGGSPEYAGLASAFVQAGARSLLVSHWPVRDDAAARLTVETLRQARSAPSRAVALQRAMLALMADRHMPNAAHPAIWAPFVLIGR